MITFCRGLAAFCTVWGGVNALGQDWRMCALWHCLAVFALMLALAIHDWRGGAR